MNKLYVVATPIGNIKDISERAKEILGDVKGIITENQNTTIKLYRLLNISTEKKKFFRYGDFNNKDVLEDVIKFIKENKNTALVTEAGTPLISDPGYKIISYVRENNLEIEIMSVPGPSSVTAHLSISGLPTDKVMFIGFLPKKKSKKERIFKSFEKVNSELNTTFLILESKYKLLNTLNTINSLYPNARISIGSELTKKFENVYYGNIEEVMQQLSKDTLRGEYILHLELE